MGLGSDAYFDEWTASFMTRVVRHDVNPHNHSDREAIMFLRDGCLRRGIPIPLRARHLLEYLPALPKKAELDRQVIADLQWWRWWRSQQRKPPDKQERDARIIALWKEGESKASIARTLGIAAATAKSAIDSYAKSAALAEKLSSERALATLASSQSKWEKDKAWRELLEGIDPEQVGAYQTTLIPLDDDEGCPGVARFACCSCGSLGDSARCRRCSIAEDAERNLRRRTLSGWDQERVRLAEYWPEEYVRRMNGDSFAAAREAQEEAREKKRRIHSLFIERLTAA